MGVQGRCQAVVHVLGGRVVVGPEVHRLHAQLGFDQRLLQQERQCRRCQVRSRNGPSIVSAGIWQAERLMLCQQLDLRAGMPELTRVKKIA